EELGDGLDVAALALHAAAEARVVELAATHFAHAGEDFVGGERQGGTQALGEDFSDAAGQAQRHHAGPARSRVMRGFQNGDDVAIVETGDDGSHVDADGDARG